MSGSSRILQKFSATATAPARAREPVNGCIVLALLDGAFTVKRYRIKHGAVVLQAENPEFPDMTVADGQSFEVRGVITRSIRML